MKEIKRERSVEEKIYTLIIENLDIELKNIIDKFEQLYIMKDNLSSVIEKKANTIIKI